MSSSRHPTAEAISYALNSYYAGLTRFQRFYRYFWEQSDIRKIRKLGEVLDRSDWKSDSVLKDLKRTLAQSSCTQTDPEWSVVSTLWKELGGESLATVKGSLKNHFLPMRTKELNNNNSWDKISIGSAISLMTVLNEFVEAGFFFWKKNYLNEFLFSDAVSRNGKHLLKGMEVLKRHNTWQPAKLGDFFSECEAAAWLEEAGIYSEDNLTLATGDEDERAVRVFLKILRTNKLLTQDHFDLIKLDRDPGALENLGSVLQFLNKAELLSKENLDIILAVVISEKRLSSHSLTRIERAFSRLVEKSLLEKDAFSFLFAKGANAVSIKDKVDLLIENREREGLYGYQAWLREMVKRPNRVDAPAASPAVAREVPLTEAGMKAVRAMGVNAEPKASSSPVQSAVVDDRKNYQDPLACTI